MLTKLDDETIGNPGLRSLAGAGSRKSIFVQGQNWDLAELAVLDESAHTFDVPRCAIHPRLVVSRVDPFPIIDGRGRKHFSTNGCEIASMLKVREVLSLMSSVIHPSHRCPGENTHQGVRASQAHHGQAVVGDGITTDVRVTCRCSDDVANKELLRLERGWLTWEDRKALCRVPNGFVAADGLITTNIDAGQVGVPSSRRRLARIYICQHLLSRLYMKTHWTHKYSGRS